MRRLQAQIEMFRTRKETLKATYTAAEAQTRVGEAVSGISDSMGDAGAVMQRAQDRITAMQARAGAIDELLASGSLTDLTTGGDDIQARLDKVASKGQVEAELAHLKSELAAQTSAASLEPPDPDPSPEGALSSKSESGDHEPGTGP